MVSRHFTARSRSRRDWLPGTLCLTRVQDQQPLWIELVRMFAIKVLMSSTASQLTVFPSGLLIAGCICFDTLMDHQHDWPLLCDHVTRGPGTEPEIEPLHLMMLSLRPETREQRDFSREDLEAMTRLREKMVNVINDQQRLVEFS